MLRRSVVITLRPLCVCVSVCVCVPSATPTVTPPLHLPSANLLVCLQIVVLRVHAFFLVSGLQLTIVF